MEVVVCVTIENSAFYLALYLTGKYLQGKLQLVGDVTEQNINCVPIRTREICGVIL